MRSSSRRRLPNRPTARRPAESSAHSHRALRTHTQPQSPPNSHPVTGPSKLTASHRALRTHSQTSRRDQQATPWPDLAAHSPRAALTWPPPPPQLWAVRSGRWGQRPAPAPALPAGRSVTDPPPPRPWFATVQRAARDHPGRAPPPPPPPPVSRQLTVRSARNCRRRPTSVAGGCSGRVGHSAWDRSCSSTRYGRSL